MLQQAEQHTVGAQEGYSHALPGSLLTFVVEGAIEVVAAGVEAGGMLDEVPSPRVPRAREARKSHKHFGLGGQEPPVCAPCV